MKIANAPCSWGVLEFDLDEPRSGDYQQVLKEMNITGYAGTELGDWGFMPTDPIELKSKLSSHSLLLLGAFVPVALADAGSHAVGEATALRTAKLLSGTAGNEPFIVLADDNGTVDSRTQNAGRIKPEHSLRIDQWDTFAAGVQRIASAVFAETGLRTVFHHHCAGFVETPEEIDILLDRTDPDLVGLCFDTGHFRFGGGDPVQGIRKYADRIRHMHFKDCHGEVRRRSQSEGWNYFKSVEQGVFCELGQGEVDFPAVVEELKKVGYDSWIVVEQDILPGMGTPLESARRNREYLAQIGL